MSLSVLAAPSNFGLRPPVPTASPGCSKAPEALRAAGLYRRLAGLGAEDSGVLLAGRWIDDHVPGSGRVRNQESLLAYNARLAGRLGPVLDRGDSSLVLGGDCSLLLGVGQALRQRGRFGLIHIDGHTDFRHPGNSPDCASVAGEDLAAAVGLHWPAIARPDGRRLFDPADVVHLGCRDDDDYLTEVRATLPLVITASEVKESVPRAADSIRAVLARSGLDGYWIHVDVDVLDPAVMPAVDSPAAGGLSPGELVDLLGRLAPRASGAHITVFDPDLDPAGSYAALLTDCAADGLAELGLDAR
jgi:arginase